MNSSDDFVQNLLSKLQNGQIAINSVAKHLKSLQSNAKKVRFCIDLLKKQNILPADSTLKNDKNESLALAERRNANEYFVAKNYIKALEHYNRSLCFSPTGSENLSIVYANRSAIYFNTGHYEACMENIELAEEHGYPDKLKPKLIKRKEDCLVLLNNNREKKTAIYEMGDVKLSYEPNPKVPCVVNGIKVATNKKYGRHIVATQDFNPGDILVIEEPFCPTLSREAVYFYCLFCLKCNLMNLKPCSESTTAMFCSKECYNESMEQFFKYEAFIQSKVYKNSEIFGPLIFVIRAALKAFCFFDIPEDLTSFIDQVPLEKLTAFDIDYSSASQKDLYQLVYALKTEIPETYPVNFIVKHCLAAYSYHILLSYTGLKEIITTTKLENFLMEMLLHLFKVRFINVNSLHGTVPYYAWNDSYKIKGAAFKPICSLFNHSCAPNVSSLGEDRGMIIVLRPIKSGEQIFDTYGECYWELKREDRQKYTMNYYGFKCQCIACENNYPLVDKAPLYLFDLSPEVAKTLYDVKCVEIEKWTSLDKAKKTLVMVNQLLKIYSSDLNSREYGSLRGAQSLLFEIIYSKPHLSLLLK